PLAIKAMAELSINIAKQQSKTLDRYLNEPFDEVITVCDTAAEACPIFPGAAKTEHWAFPGPSKTTGSEEEQLAVYRHVRDDIRARIENEPDFSVVLFRPHFMLASEEHPMKVHKNQRL